MFPCAKLGKPFVGIRRLHQCCRTRTSYVGSVTIGFKRLLKLILDWNAWSVMQHPGGGKKIMSCRRDRRIQQPVITDKVHTNHGSEQVSLNSNFGTEIHHHEFKNAAATVSSFVTLTFQGHRISLAARVSQWLQNMLTLHISYSTKNSLPFFSTSQCSPSSITEVKMIGQWPSLQDRANAYSLFIQPPLCNPTTNRHNSLCSPFSVFTSLQQYSSHWRWLRHSGHYLRLVPSSLHRRQSFRLYQDEAIIKLIFTEMIV